MISLSTDHSHQSNKRQFPGGKRQWDWRSIYICWRLAWYTTAILFMYIELRKSFKEAQVREQIGAISDQEVRSTTSNIYQIKLSYGGIAGIS